MQTARLHPLAPEPSGQMSVSRQYLLLETRYVKADEQNARQTARERICRTGPKLPSARQSARVDAKARASQAVKAGRLSKGQASKIDAKANKVIKKSAKP